MKQVENFNNLFKETTEIQSGTLSTVDHIYGSIPLRLIDSHTRLQNNFSDVCILLWDITKPLILKYKSELILDAGIYSSRNSQFHLYPLNSYYCQSHHLHPNFKKLKENTSYVLERMEYSSPEEEKYMSRLENLISTYQRCLEITSTSLEFYLQLLPSLYSLVALDDLSEFISKRMISLYKSKILSAFIPRLIQRTVGEPYGYLSLLTKHKFFKPPYFHSLEPDKYSTLLGEESWCSENIKTIINLLEERKIIPSSQIILWGFALARLKHYGNDYEFFKKLSTLLANMGYESDLEGLQLTEHKKDGQDFAKFSNYLSYQLKELGHGIKMARIDAKLSRINNLSNAYLHQGNHLYDLFRNYLITGISQPIKMGVII